MSAADAMRTRFRINGHASRNGRHGMSRAHPLQNKMLPKTVGCSDVLRTLRRSHADFRTNAALPIACTISHPAKKRNTADWNAICRAVQKMNINYARSSPLDSQTFLYQ